MKVEHKDLEKAQVEIIVTLDYKEFAPYITKGAESLSKDLKIEGFRPGKAPFDIVKSKVGEMTILEEGARMAINKTLGEAISKIDKPIIGHPDVSIVKLAPNNPLEYKAIFSLIPELTLGAYKDLGIKEDKVEVKTADVDKTIQDLSEMNVKEVIVDREVKDSDKVLVDIEMFLDKIPAEGGQGKGVAITIGKDLVIPGFDKKIIGAKKGDVREFSLPYPADHHMKNLAGKMVEFKVKIIEVYERELPELNDDFAKRFNFKGLEDLRTNIKKSIEEGKSGEAKQKAEIAILDKIVEKAKFGDIPELLIQSELDTMMHEMEAEITRQGGKFEDYLASMKKSRGDFMLDMTPNAIKRVKTALIIREISQVEKIKVEAKEIDEYVNHQLEHHGSDEKIATQLKSQEYRNYAANILTNKKVIDKLREWNVK